MASRNASILVDISDVPDSALETVEDGLTYDAVTNYARAAKGTAQSCVMCGCGASKGVVIPRQNKDVCRDCDKAMWRHRSSGCFFKWCKGCKNFLHVGTFSQKLDAAKCDRCRERGRTSYLLKKRTASGTTKAPSSRSSSRPVKVDATAASSLVALARTAPASESSSDDDDDDRMSANFGSTLQEYQRKRSRSESLGSEAESSSPEPPAEEESSGMLFELANIHARILAVESRAALVEPLEKRVAELERELAAATAARARLAAKLGEADDESSEGSRPRLISFDTERSS